MTTNYEKIIKQANNLCQTIENKFHGNADEADVQRQLGILYFLWIKPKQQEAQDE